MQVSLLGAAPPFLCASLEPLLLKGALSPTMIFCDFFPELPRGAFNWRLSQRGFFSPPKSLSPYASPFPRLGLTPLGGRYPS